MQKQSNIHPNPLKLNYPILLSNPRTSIPALILLRQSLPTDTFPPKVFTEGQGRRLLYMCICIVYSVSSDLLY